MNRERTKAYVEFMAWLALAGFLFYFSLDFREGRRGGYVLGPAFWPYLVLGLMVIATIANLGIRLLATRGQQPVEQPVDQPVDRPQFSEWMQSLKANPQLVKIVIVFIIPLVFVWGMPRFGAYITMPLFVIALLIALGEHRPLVISGITVGVCGVLFFVFTTLLYVPLPIGRVEGFYDANVAIRELLR
jgi:hypothetical protein